MQPLEEYIIDASEGRVTDFDTSTSSLPLASPSEPQSAKSLPLVHRYIVAAIGRAIGTSSLPLALPSAAKSPFSQPPTPTTLALPSTTLSPRPSPSSHSPLVPFASLPQSPSPRLHQSSLSVAAPSVLPLTPSAPTSAPRPQSPAVPLSPVPPTPPTAVPSTRLSAPQSPRHLGAPSRTAARYVHPATSRTRPLSAPPSHTQEQRTPSASSSLREESVTAHAPVLAPPKVAPPRPAAIRKGALGPLRKATAAAPQLPPAIIPKVCRERVEELLEAEAASAEEPHDSTVRDSNSPPTIDAADTRKSALTAPPPSVQTLSKHQQFLRDQYGHQQSRPAPAPAQATMSAPAQVATPTPAPASASAAPPSAPPRLPRHRGRSLDVSSRAAKTSRSNPPRVSAAAVAAAAAAAADASDLKSMAWAFRGAASQVVPPHLRYGLFDRKPCPATSLAVEHVAAASADSVPSLAPDANAAICDGGDDQKEL